MGLRVEGLGLEVWGFRLRCWTFQQQGVRVPSFYTGLDDYPPENYLGAPQNPPPFYRFEDGKSGRQERSVRPLFRTCKVNPSRDPPIRKDEED